MKKYNNLSELLHEISASRKYDTSIEAAIEYQDLIGHSDLQTLGELANGEFREMFYTVYQIAYGTVDTLKFYAKHSNYCIDLRYEKDEATAKLEILQATSEKEREESNKLLDETTNNFIQSEKDLANTRKEAGTLAKENEELKAEIIKLKAKLYDLQNA